MEQPVKAKEGLIIDSQIDMDVKNTSTHQFPIPLLDKAIHLHMDRMQYCFVFIDMGNGVEVRFDKTVATELIIN